MNALYYVVISDESDIAFMSSSISMVMIGESVSNVAFEHLIAKPITLI